MFSFNYKKQDNECASFDLSLDEEGDLEIYNNGVLLLSINKDDGMVHFSDIDNKSDVSDKLNLIPMTCDDMQEGEIFYELCRKSNTIGSKRVFNEIVDKREKIKQMYEELNEMDKEWYER